MSENKYKQLGDLLKAYTQSTTESAQDPSVQALAEAQDLQAFAAYLSAAIDNSSFTRAQVVQNAQISEVALYGLERGLIPITDIEPQALHRLADTLGEDLSTFRLLLESRVQRTEILNNQTRYTMSTEHSPIPTNEQKESPSKRPKRWFTMPRVIIPSIAFSGVAAAILVALISNSQMISERPSSIGYTSSGEILTRSQPIEPASADTQFANRADTQTRSNESVAALPVATSVAVAQVTPTPQPVPASAATAWVASAQKSLSLPAMVVRDDSNSTEMGASESELVARVVEDEARSKEGTDLVGATSSSSVAMADDALGAVDASTLYSLTEDDAGMDNSAAMALTAVSMTPTPLPTRVLPVSSAMTFIDYGLNPFTDTAADNLSTFSVDVDTGSYTIARRYLNDGQLPPPAAIRVEEFVNYFDYGYEQPAQDDVFAIHVDTHPSPFTDRRIQAEEAGDVQLMRIGIQGYDVPAIQRPDVALTFVIDVSGSMRDGGRLTLVKRALTMLVEQLRPADSIGIIVYSTQARVLLQPTQVIDANTILDAIFKLQPENSTNVAAGLELGYDMAWRNFNEQAINRVILASDGVANVDAADPKIIWEQAAQYADRGITLTSIGVGMGNYNDVIMEQLADMGDGVYGYVDTIEEAERLFVDELTGTLVTIAKDAKVQVDFNPEAVVRYRLLGYENRDVADADFRNDTVDAGEVGAGHSVTALYEVELVPEAKGEVATVNLRWQQIDSGEVMEINQPAMVNQNEISFEDAPANFQLAAVVAEFAVYLRSNLYAESQGQNLEISEEMQRWALRLNDAIGGDEDVIEMVDLISQSRRLSN